VNNILTILYSDSTLHKILHTTRKLFAYHPESSQRLKTTFERTNLICRLTTHKNDKLGISN